jgi:multiple sugar transport system substrate-binding protein
MVKRVVLLVLTGLIVSGMLFASGRGEESVGKPQKIVVATEDRPLQKVISSFVEEFEEQNNVQVEFVYFPSAELRSRIRMDASLGTGAFNVIYITEASIAEHADNEWIVPIEDYYDTDGDFDDFVPAIVDILSYGGVPYAAPLSAETTWLWYRKDLFEQRGISVPKTMDEYITAIQRFDGSDGVFGGVVRGDRGHGFNVWRWSQFFATAGGKYYEDGEWVFGDYIDEAVTATEYYLDVIATSPPGGETYTYLDAWDGFNAGRVATFIAASPKYGVTEDPAQSVVAGNVGYAPPPYIERQIAAGAAHGYAISAVGNVDEVSKELAGTFVSWATSKEIEIRRVLDGSSAINTTRNSTYGSNEFLAQFPEDHAEALADTFAITGIAVPLIPEWPEIGDNLGIILEEIFTGGRTDIRSSMVEANDFALDVLN